MDYQDYLEMVAKKEARKAKKKAKKLAKKQAVEKIAKEAAPEPVRPMQTEAPRYTQEERDMFRRRIDNEKANIWRTCHKNAEEIIKYCEENAQDERNVVIRIARGDAMAWAKKELGINEAAPF